MNKALRPLLFISPGRDTLTVCSIKRTADVIPPYSLKTAQGKYFFNLLYPNLIIQLINCFPAKAYIFL